MSPPVAMESPATGAPLHQPRGGLHAFNCSISNILSNILLRDSVGHAPATAPAPGFPCWCGLGFLYVDSEVLDVPDGGLERRLGCVAGAPKCHAVIRGDVVGKLKITVEWLDGRRQESRVPESVGVVRMRAQEHIEDVAGSVVPSLEHGALVVRDANRLELDKLPLEQPDRLLFVVFVYHLSILGQSVQWRNSKSLDGLILLLRRAFEQPHALRASPEGNTQTG
jgi:hypothetical protein